MKTTATPDALNRIVLSREVRRAAGIYQKQKLLVSATAGRIVLEIDATGSIVKRGKLKIWTGAVPNMPIEDAVEQMRRERAVTVEKGSSRERPKLALDPATGLQITKSPHEMRVSSEDVRTALGD